MYWDPSYLIEISNQFIIPPGTRTISPIDSGNINDTFHVITDNQIDRSVILQRLNHLVFENPNQVTENIVRITRQIQNELNHRHIDPALNQWKIPRPIQLRTSDQYLLHINKQYWRMFTYIPNATSRKKIHSAKQASSVGQALGLFHSLASNSDVSDFHTTIKQFHHTPTYINTLEEQIETRLSCSASDNLDDCLLFFDQNKHWANTLEVAKEGGILRKRLIHGDPKVSNILIHEKTEKPLSLIDLDTVQPGLIHYDIGDCLRSACNMAGEDPMELNRVAFDLDICDNVLSGYLEIASGILTPEDYKYIFDAVRVITFELGVRFLTDYLRGNIYFKVEDEAQNLRRCVAQFKLVADILSKKSQITALVISRQT